MVKTTLYLPDQLKRRIERVAATEGRSEADIIRSAVDHYTAGRQGGRPRLPLFDSGRGDLVDRLEEQLEGFGYGED